VDEKVTEDDQTPPDKTSQAVDKEDSLPDESNQQLTPEDPETDASGNAESQN
jgi:hypothetical protein